jgi:hypothetical protein
LGDPTYPKAGGLTLAGAFCAPASASAFVDVLVGLPGPAAIVLPMADGLDALIDAYERGSAGTRG